MYKTAYICTLAVAYVSFVTLGDRNPTGSISISPCPAPTICNLTPVVSTDDKGATKWYDICGKQREERNENGKRDARKNPAEITGEQVKDFGYGIKYFQFDAVPTPEQKARLAALRERLAQIEAEEKAQRQARRRQNQWPAHLCDCGHYDTHPMMTSSGTACANCYDRMSD